MEACAAQCDTWGGRGDEHSSYFARLVRRYPGGPSATGLERGARAAARAYLEFGTWLRQDYLPGATPVDPVGRDLYSVSARYFTGSELDLEDTYRFGWSELHRIEARMSSVCEQIAPGKSLAEVIDQLEADPDRVIEGVDAFRAWNQELIDATISVPRRRPLRHRRTSSVTAKP